jgi:hypothetical protein
LWLQWICSPGRFRRVRRGRPTLEVRPYRPARPAADPLEELRGSVLRFDDPFAPVGKNNWEALA